ncbi:hypothetical protein GCM10009642_53430 [Nocardiopsis metallicus]
MVGIPVLSGPGGSQEGVWCHGAPTFGYLDGEVVKVHHLLTADDPMRCPSGGQFIQTCSFSGGRVVYGETGRPAATRPVQPPRNRGSAAVRFPSAPATEGAGPACRGHRGRGARLPRGRGRVIYTRTVRVRPGPRRHSPI